MAQQVKVLTIKTQGPYGERRQSTPISCPLTSTLALRHAYTHAHTKKKKLINTCNKSMYRPNTASRTRVSNFWTALWVALRCESI